MRITLLLVMLGIFADTKAQLIDSLNTAKNCSYMKPEEREMVYEVNMVRTNPKSYLPFIEPLLERAKTTLKNFGKGSKNYSVSYSTIEKNGKEVKRTDTVWHYTNEEEVKALTSLVNDLRKMKPLSLLQPDTGIYKAGQKHAADQDAHEWLLMHQGSDGSWPWDRILKFSPAMTTGNENIAGHYPEVSAREIVIQLLVDSSIPGYGHRYNMLDPKWTHIACIAAGMKEGMCRWLQEFGQKK